MATFFNQATLSFNGRLTNSNTTEGEITENLTAIKTAISGSYGKDDTVAYAISIVNRGTSALCDLEITDNLGAYAFGTGTLYPLTYLDGSLKLFLDGVLTAAPTVTAGPPLVISGINIPQGSSAVIIYEALTNAYTPIGAGSTVTNTATVSTPSLSDTITLEAVSSVRLAPDLTIAKAICPSEVTDNGQLTYTFVILNHGNEDAIATDDVIVTDVFTPILNPINVTYNGENWTEGTNYTYDETTGEFATLQGNITVPAATFTQDPISGIYTVTPGVSVITVTGTV